MALVDGGDLVARAIKQEGVDTIFTLCGGHVQAIYDSCIDEDIRIIDVRHEQVAGHAAEGWSRATRRCGVGVVTASIRCNGLRDGDRERLAQQVADADNWRAVAAGAVRDGRASGHDHTEMLKPITKFAKASTRRSAFRST